MTQPTLFDAAESVRRRDEALETVSANSSDFMEAGLSRIAELAPGNWTGEGIRIRLSAGGLEPHHPNAWGALICTAVRREILEPTGRYEAMTAKSSHARKTAVYQKGY